MLSFRFWVADYNVKTESEELYSTFAYWREPICNTKSSFSFDVRVYFFFFTFVFMSIKIIVICRMTVMIKILTLNDFKL